MDLRISPAFIDKQIPFKRLALTPITIAVPREARVKTLTKAFEQGKVLEKWNASAWAKKLAQKEKRSDFSDFDRFKSMLAKKKKSSLVNKELAKLKKEKMKSA
eukprot:EC119972.1.p2 GENE.EC119972.1~~EC119972.1.p2  ORF type:complete len:103 (+),score=31.10 EC119972.1:177-485(+)